MNHVAQQFTSPPKLDDILDAEFSGDLKRAHDLYVAYFESNEIRFDELNLFAVCCMQVGKTDKAEKLFEVVTENAPHIVEAFIHLSELKARNEDFEGALEVLNRDSVSEEDYKFIHLPKAKLHVSLGDYKSALECVKSAYEVDQECVDTLLLYAQIEKALGNQSESMTLLKKLMFFHPENTDGLLLQAHWHLKHGNWDAAAADAKIITEQNPKNINALMIQVKALQALDANKEFLFFSKKLFRAAPHMIEAMEALCTAYSKNEEPEAAINVAANALKLHPDRVNLSIMQAGAYFGMGHMEQAFDIINAALEFNPEHIDALLNKGVIQERLLDIDGAKETYRKLLHLDPSRSATKFNLALCELLQGNFHEGFALYENRFNKSLNLVKFYLGDEPVWDGSQSLDGKHLLVHPEQGYGDTIMACRFINYLEGKGARVTFAVPRPLKSLIETFETDAGLAMVGDNVGKIDLHCPLLSLPHLTADTWDELPSADSYLKVPDAAERKWKEKFADQDRLRVGFVCSGNAAHANDFNRSILMSELLEAFPDGAEYHLLQKELRATDKAALLRRPDIVRYDSDIQDFADTAAICEKMDLVVTVDTSVAHLAGALGKKTLLMTPLWPEWRWGLGRSKSKWYPNTQIVRQLTAGDWSPVLEFIAIAVDKEIKLKRREAA